MQAELTLEASEVSTELGNPTSIFCETIFYASETVEAKIIFPKQTGLENAAPESQRYD